MMRKLIGLFLMLLSAAQPLSAAVSCSVVQNAGAGTVQISSAGVVTGSGTSFNANYYGTEICVAGTCGFVTTFTSSTSLTLNNGSWSGTTASGQPYTVGQISHPLTNSAFTVTFVNNF